MSFGETDELWVRTLTVAANKRRGRDGLQPGP